ncbi:9225_t:CDS:2, partial [Funneliformis geosporum]
FTVWAEEIGYVPSFILNKKVCTAKNHPLTTGELERNGLETYWREVVLVKYKAKRERLLQTLSNYNDTIQVTDAKLAKLMNKWYNNHTEKDLMDNDPESQHIPISDGLDEQFNTEEFSQDALVDTNGKNQEYHMIITIVMITMIAMILMVMISVHAVTVVEVVFVIIAIILVQIEQFEIMTTITSSITAMMMNVLPDVDNSAIQNSGNLNPITIMKIWTIKEELIAESVNTEDMDISDDNQLTPSLALTRKSKYARHGNQKEILSWFNYGEKFENRVHEIVSNDQINEKTARNSNGNRSFKPSYSDTIYNNNSQFTTKNSPIQNHSSKINPTLPDQTSLNQIINNLSKLKQKFKTLSDNLIATKNISKELQQVN